MPKSSENSYNYTELAMALLPILCYPDPRLHKVAKPVEKVDERIRKQIEDMFETMYEANGVGLAAPQVTYLMHELKERGLEVNTDATTVAEARESLLEVLLGRIPHETEMRENAMRAKLVK